MIEQQTLEQIKLFLNQEFYEDAIAFLEKYIEENPEELTYYWYLGLVHLLQENEEIAQEIWVSVFLQGNLEEIEQWTTELTEFLETKVEENLAERKLGNAKIIYETIFVINPDYENTKLLDKLVESLSYFASGLIHENEREAALEVYLQILELNPHDAISWRSLALNYYYLERYDKAKESIQKSIEYDSLSAQSYHILGLILEKIEKYASAIEVYNQSIKKNPKFIEPYNNLAKVYLQQQQVDKAIEIYKLALDIAPIPFRVNIFKKLANIYETLDDKASAALYLGYSAYFDDNNQDAITHFEEFLTTKTGSSNMYCTLGSCYISTDQPLSAITLIEKALDLFPNDLSLRRLDQSILPIIYHNVEEIHFYRQRFSQLLENLIEYINSNVYEDQQEVFKSLQTGTNFYLGYQGENDLKIQKKYGSYVYTLMQKLYPQWCKKLVLDQNIQQRKIRIGYVSLRLHGLGIFYLGWIKYCDKSKFETYVYDISCYEEDSKDYRLEFRENFKIHSDHIKFISGGLEDLCTTVRSDEVDILIFPEIGIDAKISSLSCLRLAPIQCTTWAHPITSGSPTIDYFLSSDLMEPDNGEEHYSETLIRLPNIGFAIDPPDVSSSDKQRSDFQLRDDAIVYFSCQTLFKYLPQHDYIFPSIAQQNKLAQFMFIDSFLGPVITSGFKRRLDKAFSEFGLNYESYCVFLPRASSKDYVRLNQLSDVFLDGLSWSGGITTREAIACSLPVVTCPGKVMRARHSYGILRMIDVTETIATNETEYIEIAVRLGLDHEWRQEIRDKIATNQHRLFDDRECIVALEAFFEEAIEKHSRQST
jgi:predicted O-linked N-acetylglucosamine transferase (SPINDLY family)